MKFEMTKNEKKKNEYTTLRTMTGADFGVLKNTHSPEELSKLEEQMSSWDVAKKLPSIVADAKAKLKQKMRPHYE